ncbi:MAG: phosphoribosyl-ATP diphosphatase [Sphingomonadales bacterium]|nr:phosphoribosyl-ATP diphosphatase [Sphingomonadales bacterium]
MTEQGYDIGAVIERVFAVIESRRGADPETSYVAKLFHRGRGKIAQKLGEEAVETVIAGIDGKKQELIGESTDLLFHLMVLWANAGINPAEVAAELARREGISGLEEKKSRNW